jgi:hypothetical protein
LLFKTAFKQKDDLCFVINTIHSLIVGKFLEIASFCITETIYTTGSLSIIIHLAWLFIVDDFRELINF